jgi:hypothetical protein
MSAAQCNFEFDAPAPTPVRLSPVIAIDEHKDFQTNSEPAPMQLLPRPADLNWAVNVVLVATRSIKPSYGGISNYRFHTAHRETGITQEEWESAKQFCISRSLLKPTSAITDEGRRAVAQFSSLQILKGNDQ